MKMTADLLHDAITSLCREYVLSQMGEIKGQEGYLRAKIRAEMECVETLEHIAAELRER